MVSPWWRDVVKGETEWSSPDENLHAVCCTLWVHVEAVDKVSHSECFFVSSLFLRRVSPGSGPERPSGGTESRLRSNSRPNSPRDPK